MAHKRTLGQRPRLVGKPFAGQPKVGSKEYEALDPDSIGAAERLKGELQRFLDILEAASNQSQVDIEALEQLLLAQAGLEELPKVFDPAGLHPFLVMGA